MCKYSRTVLTRPERWWALGDIEVMDLPAARHVHHGNHHLPTRNYLDASWPQGWALRCVDRAEASGK